MDIWEIIISIFGSTALVSILAFLAKTWISERLKQEIKHEYDLKLKEVENKYDREQISLKANTEKDVSIYQYKLEQVHPKRTQLIEKLNMDIHDINRDIELYIDVIELTGENMGADCFSEKRNLSKTERTFFRFATMAELYLTPQLNESLRIIKKHFSSICIKMYRNIDDVNKYDELLSDLKNEYQSIQSEIENFFNLSKGVINESTK